MGEDFNTPEMQAAAAAQKEQEDLAAEVAQDQDQTDSGPPAEPTDPVAGPAMGQTDPGQEPPL